MGKFILRNIDFNKCSSYVLLSGFVWLVSVAMVPVKSIPQKPFQTVFHFIELCLSLYIYLGFVKFSILQKKDTFRKLIVAALVLSIIQVLISMTATLMENKNLYNYNSVAVTIEAALLFYAFKSVQDVKTIDFRKLSRLYFYLLFFYVPTSISLLLGKENLNKFMPQMMIKPLIILAMFWAALIVYTWYMKSRLFKQISKQMY